MNDPGAGNLRELEFDLASEDEGTRRNALAALASTRHNAQLLDRLKRIAAEDPSAELRYLAKRFYSKIKESLAGQLRDQVKVVGPEGIDLSNLYATLNAEEAEVRLEAMRQVMEARDKKALPILLRVLQREQDAWVIASLVKGIGVLGDATHIRVLQPYLRHSDPRVCANTVEALDLIGDDLVIPILVPLLEHPDHRVAGNAVKALLKFDREQAVAALDRMAASPKESARDAAIYCLSLLDPAAADRILLKLFATEAFPALLQKEADALASQGTRAVLPEICRLARSTSGGDRSVLARKIQRAIADRENVTAEELVGMEHPPAKETPPPGPAPAAVDGSARSRPTRAMVASKTVKASPPTAPVQTVAEKIKGVASRLPLPALILPLVVLGGAVAWLTGGGSAGPALPFIPVESSGIVIASRAHE
ncbi:MAG: HEAT repeat domain-containing protein, partial [Candidatus Riflebacteria bacterium]|nr:HEAT repeat domain-containing protein [Candidatus Riflebacteria bacterium]